MTWRIDDLARTAGLTVDTVRYYQREGLLPPPVREGRHVLYGPDHLARLERVRELQARRFSLAAIRSLLDADRPELVEGIFDGSDAAYSFDELITRSGIAAPLAQALRDADVLRDPAEFGRDAYDHEDLDLCRAVAEIADLGVSGPTIIEIGRIYTAGIEAMQRQVVELFASQASTLTTIERDAFALQASEDAPVLLPHVQRLVGYVHHRTIQRLTLAAIDRTRQAKESAAVTDAD
jgi:DNA-binding transcriptional MerR regulator